ncbi:hypothetical protein [Rhodopirellula halodulae]|uniref:hypothetical protein n=1 Tax=Rhodopirellula halodulae TaxID=2894198 RepID=UPI001E4C3AD4|nr:hypothetical protein [Rhodopirellula sp. JC737]MCC9655297.1 hypothetical protein [Rhodopirellula sp. JC737]
MLYEIFNGLLEDLQKRHGLTHSSVELGAESVSTYHAFIWKVTTELQKHDNYHTVKIDGKRKHPVTHQLWLSLDDNLNLHVSNSSNVLRINLHEPESIEGLHQFLETLLRVPAEPKIGASLRKKFLRHILFPNRNLAK